MAILRYTATGTVDTGFGGGPIATTPAAAALARAVAVQDDGKIVVAGTNAPVSELIVARFNANGSLDMTFGPGGSSVIAPGAPVVLLLGAANRDPCR